MADIHISTAIDTDGTRGTGAGRPNAPGALDRRSAENALAVASSPAEVKQLYDLAEAYRTYAEKGKEQNWAASFKLRAGAKGGRLLKADPLLGKGKSARLADLFPGVVTVAARMHLSARWQRLDSLDEDGTLDAYLASDADEITMAGLIAYATTGNLFSSASPEWYTPAKYVEAVRDVLGDIDLDPASSADANMVVRAGRYFTRDDHALDQPWHGRVFTNPPYGRSATEGCNRFIPKLVAEYQAGRTTAAVALVSAHSTDADWFQVLWDYPVCFTDHRLAYWRADSATTGALFGSVFAYLGPEPGRFAERFADFGPVVARWRP